MPAHRIATSTSRTLTCIRNNAVSHRCRIPHLSPATRRASTSVHIGRSPTADASIVSYDSIHVFTDNMVAALARRSGRKDWLRLATVVKMVVVLRMTTVTVMARKMAVLLLRDCPCRAPLGLEVVVLIVLLVHLVRRKRRGKLGRGRRGSVHVIRVVSAAPASKNAPII